MSLRKQCKCSKQFHTTEKCEKHLVKPKRQYLSFELLFFNCHQELIFGQTVTGDGNFLATLPVPPFTQDVTVEYLTGVV